MLCMGGCAGERNELKANDAQMSIVLRDLNFPRSTL
jgi:hypothetical protein